MYSNVYICIVMKTEILPIRVTKEMKSDLQDLANQQDRSLSDYLRLLFKKIITEHHKNFSKK